MKNDSNGQYQDIEQNQSLRNNTAELQHAEIYSQHSQMLRGVVEHLIGSETQDVQKPKTKKSPIAQLISPEALLELEQIQESLKKLSFANDGSRKYLELDENEALADRIEAWIKNHLCREFSEEDFKGEASSEANSIVGEAWFGFEALVELQNAESVAVEIERVVLERNYFQKNYLEKKELKANLEQRLVSEFKLKPAQAQELAEISLLYKPLDEEIDKFLQNQKFEDKDWIEQEQLKKKFLKEAANKYPVKPSKLSQFFDLKVELKEGKGAWATLKDINERYKILKDHKLLAGSRLGLNLTGDAFLVAAPVLMSMQENLGWGFAAFFASTLGGVLSKQGSQLCFNGLANKIEKKINRDTTRAHHYREYQDMSRASMGQIMEASRTGKEAVINILRNASDLPSLVLQPLAAAGLLMYINPYLGLTSLAGMVTIGGGMYAQGVITGEKQREQLIVHEEAATKLDQTIGAIQEIRLSPNIQELEEGLRAKQNQGDDANKSIANIENYFGIGLGTSSLLSSMATAALGGYLGVPDTKLMSVLMYSGRIMQPIMEGFAKVNNTVTEGVPAANRLHKITGNPDEIILPGSEVEAARVGISELDDYRIEIKDLNFLNILNGVSLTIEEGDFVTITGPSGIGKSTLLKNILGLLKPDEGSVSVGGTETKDIKKYDPEESLFNLVSYADQKPQVLVGETLRDNLLLGLKDVSDERIVEVMTQLGLYKEGIEPGVDKSDPTVVNFALDDVVDHDLSGGQKVRLGLARALLRDAKVILLDEPTASLDKDAAKEVRQLLVKLHEEKPGTSIVCVTHDDNLIEESNRIGRTYSLQKEVNNVDTVDGLRDLILSVQPDQPEDAQKFLTEDLYALTGVDVYDLRRVLIPSSNQEGVIYSNMIWNNQV